MRSQNDPEAMLRNGQRILAEAGTNADQLGHALSQIHSALERHFRQSLAANPQVPADIHARLAQAQDMNRIELIDLMMRYGGLSGSAARTIRDFNRLRNAIQHENYVYEGSRQAIEQYARLVESTISGPDRLLAAAAYPDELFAATAAGLELPLSPKAQAAPNAAASAARPQPADAPVQPPATTAPRPALPASRGAAPVRDARGNQGEARRTFLLVLVLLAMLAALLYATLPRAPAPPLQPTPTLSLPASSLRRSPALRPSV
jgi:uncharacterized protein YutE (UPF0331/DUF86 family)